MTPIQFATRMLLGAMMLTAAAGTLAARERTASGRPLPPKVIVDDALRHDIEEIAALSPTVRRQLAAIEAAPVQIEVRASAIASSLSRAETVISRYESGYIKAVVMIPASVDFVELLAHELEHVVEQIEGTDLEALARTREASRNAAGVFETIRARDAGRAAAAEVEEAVRALRAVD